MKGTEIFHSLWVWDEGKNESTKLFRKFRFNVRQNFLKCDRSSIWNKIPSGSVESLPYRGLIGKNIIDILPPFLGQWIVL